MFKGNLGEGVNPIVNILLIITGDQGEVYMDPVVDKMSQNNGEEVANVEGGAARLGAFANCPTQQQLIALHSQLMQLHKGINMLCGSFEQDQVNQNQQYMTMKSNVHQMAI